MRRVFFGIFIAIVGLIVLVAGTLVVRHVRQKEWVPPDVAVNLESKWPILRESDVRPDSAFGMLRQAAEAQARTPKSEDERKELARLFLEPWSNESFPVLAKLSEQNGRSLQLARSAAAAPNPQVPTSMSITDRSDYLMPMMRLHEALRISSAQKVVAGDVAGAFDDLQVSAANARILSRGGLLIHMLLGISTEGSAYRSMRLMALQYPVAPEVASQTLQQLQTMSASTEPLDAIVRQEYRCAPGMVDMMFKSSGPSMMTFDPEASANERWMRRLLKWCGWTVGSTRDEVTADVARVYKSVVATVAQPYNKKQMEFLENGLIPKLESREIFFYRDPAGYVVASLILPLYPGLVTRYHRGATELNATIAVVGVRQFQQNEHRAPVSLDELVPKYLPAVPNDPFDGKPFRYRIGADGKWVVYSVGPNQIDEGGKRTEKVPHTYKDEGDIIFSESDLEWERERLKARNKGS